jgi:uncharacterized protein
VSDNPLAGASNAVAQAVDEVLHQARSWAAAEPRIQAIALVGSCARGTPRPDSDIDLVVLATDPETLGTTQEWFSHFGTVTLVQQRQFGPVAERRLRRHDGIEIEVGLAPLNWADTDPLDGGTQMVVRGGFTLVCDPGGILTGLAAAAGGTAGHDIGPRPTNERDVNADAG